MLTSKQRAELRAMGNTLEAIVQIGKGGINDNLIRQMDDALTARELVKAHVLETAQQLAEATRSEVVQVIGTKFILYRRNQKNPKIQLKKTKK